MSAWTWTHIKIDVITKKQGLKYCELAEKNINNIWYYNNYKKLSYDEALEKYKTFIYKNKKYFIDECNMPEYKFSNNYINNEFKEKIEKLNKLQNYINKYRNNEITFVQLVNESSLSECSHCKVKIYNGDKYIKQYGEIFRLRQYDTCDLNLHTVEDLIDYLRSNKRQQFICDFAEDLDKDGNIKYEGLTDELVQRIRDHYGKIGDNNFIVNFG